MARPYVVGLLTPFTVGRGYSEAVHIPAPAAGAVATYRVAGGDFERLRTISFQLVTAAAAANRIATVSILDQDAAVIARVAAPFLLTAAHTGRFLFGIGVQQAGVNDGATINGLLPELFLQPGWSVVIGVTGVQAADQLSGIVLYRERFPTGPEGYEYGPGVENGG